MDSIEALKTAWILRLKIEGSCAAEQHIIVFTVLFSLLH